MTLGDRFPDCLIDARASALEPERFDQFVGELLIRTQASV